MDYPKLWPPLILGILAVLCTGIAVKGSWSDNPTMAQQTTRFIWVLLAIVFFSYAVVYMVNWIAYNAAERLKEYRSAIAITERVRILEAVKHLTPEQVKLVGASGITLDWIVGSDGTAIPMTIETPGGAVPVDFFEIFMSLSDDITTVPIRTWGDGSIERQYARNLTSALISMGWAEPSAGNMAARWRNRTAAEMALKRIAG